MAFRRPVSRPLAARAFRLRVAGAAEVLRLRYEVTMLMVEPAAPTPVEERETERLPRETNFEMVYGNNERRAA